RFSRDWSSDVCSSDLRQEKNLAETQAAYQALVVQLEAATRVQARLRREIEQEGADKQKLSAQLKLVNKAYADLEAQVQRTAQREIGRASCREREAICE